MGTDYKIIQKETHTTKEQMYILEQSNKFDLYFNIENVKTDITASINDLSEEDLLQLALKTIQVCSYFMDTDELKEKINTFINKNIY